MQIAILGWADAMQIAHSQDCRLDPLYVFMLADQMLLFS